MEKMQTPLGRAYGLGSAKEGAHGWWQLRVTSVALIPLTVWWVISILVHAGAGYNEFVLWVHRPIVAILLLVTIVATFIHMALGLQEVVEDYVHEWTKIVALFLVRFGSVLLAVAAVFSVLRIAFGGV